MSTAECPPSPGVPVAGERVIDLPPNTIIAWQDW